LTKKIKRIERKKGIKGTWEYLWGREWKNLFLNNMPKLTATSHIGRACIALG